MLYVPTMATKSTACVVISSKRVPKVKLAVVCLRRVLTRLRPRPRATIPMTEPRSRG